MISRLLGLFHVSGLTLRRRYWAAGLLYICGSSFVPAVEPRAAAEQLLAALERKDFATAFAQFSPEMKTALPEKALRAACHSIWVQVGALERTLKTVSARDGDTEVITITGEFTRGRLNVIVAFDPDGTVSGLNFRPTPAATLADPPPYAPRDATRESEITLSSAGLSLPGTLAVPVARGPWAGVVLVHGSGAHDRDETVGGVRVFRDLALGLAAKGIAVLRYDKRTRVVPLEKYARPDGTFTVQEETVDDAVAAVARLRQVDGVDPKRIVIVGHSLGGTVAPRIVRADPTIAGVVMLAGTPRQLPDLIVEQNRYMLSLQGPMSEAQAAQIKLVEATAARIAGFTAADASSKTLVWGAPPRYWLDLREDDPTAAAQALRQPMLILQGERDYQVTMRDFALWRAALGERPQVTFKSYPQLNHLFVAGEGASQPREYESPAYVSADVVAQIATWIGAAVR